jgi:hypothetical protein
MFIGPCVIVITEEYKNQVEATYYFIVVLIDSTCFGHYYAHHQEFATMMLINTLVVSLCKMERVALTFWRRICFFNFSTSCI